MQLRNRHVQGAAVGVFEVEEFHPAFAHVHIDQAVITADAVLRVDDRVALAQLGQVAHHGLDVAGALLVAFTATAGGGETRVQVVLGQEDQVGLGQLEAGGQRGGDDAEMGVRGQEGLDGVGLRVRRHAEFVQHLHQRFAPARGIRAQQHPRLARLDQGAQLGDGILGAPRHADVGGGAEIGMRVARAQGQAAEALQAGIERLAVEEQSRGGRTGRSRSL